VTSSCQWIKLDFLSKKNSVYTLTSKTVAIIHEITAYRALLAVKIAKLNLNRLYLVSHGNSTHLEIIKVINIHLAVACQFACFQLHSRMNKANKTLSRVRNYQRMVGQEKTTIVASTAQGLDEDTRHARNHPPQKLHKDANSNGNVNFG
jgi:hypothetical protein